MCRTPSTVFLARVPRPKYQIISPLFRRTHHNPDGFLPLVSISTLAPFKLSFVSVTTSFRSTLLIYSNGPFYLFKWWTALSESPFIATLVKTHAQYFTNTVSILLPLDQKQIKITTDKKLNFSWSIFLFKTNI